MGVGICSDLLVVEIGGGKVAPAQAGMLLADNGARVLKIEPPEGDQLRRSVPSGWLAWNRGKESVVADLDSDDGRTLVRELTAAADVVIDGLDAGGADRLGLGYDDVVTTNPEVVYCSIKGYGSSGPYANVPAYDAVVMAKNGSFSRGDFGFRDGPIFSGALLASIGAAHQAVSSILAALVVRDRTGRGQWLESTLFQGLNPIDYFVSYHVQLGARAAEAAAARQNDDETERQPAAEAPRVPAATRYMVSSSTSDGRWFFFSPQQPHQAKALMQVLELEELIEDPRFKDMPAFWTLEDGDEWDQTIHRRMKERTAAEWVARAVQNDNLPFEVVLSAEEALDHPQIRANGNVVTVVDPAIGEIEQIGPVAAFERTPSIIERSAPTLGQHDDLGPEVRTSEAERSALPSHPLAGLTIVELGYYYAMPYGVTMAGALGARVIKIEAIGGDPMRWSFGAPEWGAAKTMEGKESICIDVGTEQGRAIVHELLRRADAFVQGFRPGVDRRLGMDYETVRGLNPEIVYMHGAGYGQTGPYAHRPIYAGTAAALAGSVHRQAAYWLDPELNASLDAIESQVLVAPRMRNMTDGDANAALGVMTGLLFALRHRARTGEGQFVGTSMIGGNVLAYSDDFIRYEGKVPVRQADSEQLGVGALERLYRAAEGWVCLVVPTDGEWLRFTEAIERPDLATDERFASAESRDGHDAELASELEDVFTVRPAAEWEELLLGRAVGCVVANEMAQAVTSVSDPVLQEMGLMQRVEHPLFGEVLRYGAPAQFSATPPRIEAGCTIAQHTAAILGELGYEPDEIEKLVADGVVRVAD